jgi:hypothetical protein
LKNAKASSISSVKIIATLLILSIALLYIFKTNPADLPNPKSPEEVSQSPESTPEPFAKNMKNAVHTSPKEDALGTNQEMIRAEFEKLSQEVQARLPLTAQFKQLRPHEVHTVPALIQKAGEDLGLIAQALHDNPHLASSAQEFYMTCFKRSELPAQVRGLCLANHRRLRIEHGDRVPWTEPELEGTTEEVRKLADKIPL